MGGAFGRTLEEGKPDKLKASELIMRREGHIIEEIITDGNLSASLRHVLRGRGKSRSGRWLLAHREEVISDLKARLGDGSYRISGYRTFTVSERGKEREIQSIPLADRVALHAVMRVVERHLKRRFIADSAASIKGRGTHYLHRRMCSDMRRDPSGTLYVYKCDVRRFYQSIDQSAMKSALRRVFKDGRLLRILDGFVTLLPQGISIGLRSSQALGNLLLDRLLDHELKDGRGVRHYRRYCDDIVVQAGSYAELTALRSLIRERLSQAGLRVKGNEQMFRTDRRPIDFLGYLTYGDGNVRLRGHIKRRFARRWGSVRSPRRRTELIGSFYGMAKHARARHLFKTITGMKMKDFAEFGLSYKAADGKKRFDCKSFSLGELQNRTIIVEDYETGVKTREGEDRYIVKFRSEETGEGKFFTSSEEMKQMLDGIRALDGYPFRTTIKRHTFGGGKMKYSFT